MVPYDTVYVDGVGHIGQYDSWLTMLERGDMGILYLFRDVYYRQIQAECSHSRKVHGLVHLYNNVNHILVEHEKRNGFPYFPSHLG